MGTNKSQINTFGAGMNLDTDKSLLKSTQYRYAENIRTVTNNNATTGSITNIEGSTELLNTQSIFSAGEEIIATSTIRDIGVVFTKFPKAVVGTLSYQYIDDNDPATISIPHIPQQSVYVEDSRVTPSPIDLTPNYFHVDTVHVNNESPERVICGFSDLIPRNMTISIRVTYNDSTTDELSPIIGPDTPTYTTNATLDTLVIDLTKTFNTTLSVLSIEVLSFEFKNNGIPCDENGGENWDPNADPLTIRYKGATQYFRYELTGLDSGPSLVTEPDIVTWHYDIVPEQLAFTSNVLSISSGSVANTIKITLETPLNTTRNVTGVIFNSTSGKYNGVKSMTFVNNTTLYFNGNYTDIIFNREVEILSFTKALDGKINVNAPSHLIPAGQNRQVFIQSTNGVYDTTVTASYVDADNLYIYYEFSDNIEKSFKIYRVTFTNNTTPIFKNVVNPNGVDFDIPEDAPISIVGRYEDFDNIKVYWADGSNFTRVINIAESNDSKNALIENETMFDIVPSSSLPAPSITSIGAGRLNAGLIQYFYQLYSPSGGETELSPSSPVVHLTESEQSDYSISYLGTGLGEIYGKPTGKSVKVSIDIPTGSQFTKLKLISLYYYNYSDVPTITIVKETDITTSVFNNKVFVEDGGTSALGELTQAEFNLIGGNVFKPTYIESKDNILFAANTTEDTWDIPISKYDTRSYQFNSSKTALLYDSAGGTLSLSVDTLNLVPETHDCIHKEIYSEDRYSDLLYIYDRYGNLGGTGLNIDYKFANTYFIESYGDYYNKKNTNGAWASDGDKYIDQRTARIGDKKRSISKLTTVDSSGVTTDINLTDLNIPIHNGFLNYSNPYLSNNLTSYQRDEIYRFACVFYDAKGRKSPAKWIADIRFPAGYIESSSWNSSIFETPAESNSTVYSNTFLNDQELLVKPLGVKFVLRNLPSDIKKVEIVRAKRDINNKTIYAQGAIQKTGTYRAEYQQDHDGNVANIIAGGLVNTLRPHPVLSMGYALSITGIGRSQKKLHTPSVSTNLPDAWIEDWHDFDDNRYYVNSDLGRILPNYTDHAISPYFYNKSDVLFINPETSYYGVDFTEQLRKVSGAIDADIVDIIYPVSTPPVVGMGINVTGSSYFGHPDHNRLQFYLVDDSSHKYYPSAMYFGADINKRLYTTGITINDHSVFMSMGLVGANYRLVSNSSSATQYLQNVDATRTDIKYPTIGYFNEPFKRAFLSIGGVLRYVSGSTYCFKNGFVYDITNTSHDKALITIDDANDAGVSGMTFKYFNRYSGTKLNTSDTISLVYQNSNSLLDYTAFTYSGLNINKSTASTLLTKKIKSFEYSGDIASGLPIEKISGAQYVSSGGSQYLNWAKPLTTGNEGEPSQNDTITGPSGMTKVGGPHGSAIILNLEVSEQFPTITDINQTRKKYTSGALYDGYKSLDRIGSSALSTFIVNLKVMNDYIYGGSSLVDRQFTEYISTGVSFDNTGASIEKLVFGGDTFIGLFDYTLVMATDPYCDSYGSDTKGRHPMIENQVKHIGALIPVESSINLHLVNSKSYIASDNNFAIQREPGVYSPGASQGSEWKITQQLPQYSYNSAYSADMTGIGFESKLLVTEDNKIFDCRVWYSGAKTNDEIYDSWSKFQVANYIDVDTQYGEITGIRKFDNKLFFWQKNSFGVLSVNERALIKDNNISTLTLGSGGVLSRFDYISTSNGMKKDMICGISDSESGLYWMDIERAEICIYGSSITPLSKAKGIQTVLNSNKSNISNKIPMIFDKKYNEMIITLNGLTGVDNIR